MKKILILLFMSVCLTSVNGQINTNYYNDSEQGDSVVNSFIDIIKSSVAPSKKINIPKVDVTELLREDQKREGKNVPFRFGKDIDQNLTLNDGTWIDIDSGRLWSLSFKADSALSLNFIFNDFYLPDEGELYIVNHNNTIVYGPVTSKTIGNGNHFLTDVIPDSEVTICLYEPSHSRGMSSLNICKAIYGYRSAMINRNGMLVSSADSCECDMGCYPLYERESKAVALILLSNGGWACTGSLVMSTDMSYKPYILTSLTCFDSNYDRLLSDEEISNVQNCAFKFNYKRKNCYNYEVENTTIYNNSIYRASSPLTSFLLVEIDQNLYHDGRHTWLGWDRTGNTPLSSICIHHSEGNVMKLAFDFNQSYSLSWYGINDNYWQSDFDAGYINYGSLGAPLLNNERKVVGQLNGEPSLSNPYDICSQIHGFSGKFSLSWTGNDTNNTRLSNWLDPNGTGVTIMPSSFEVAISGQDYIFNTGLYSLPLLPDTVSVNWTLTGNNAANFVLQSSSFPSHYCTLTRIDSAEFDGPANLTLTAQLTYGGSSIYTTKQLIAPYVDGPMIPCGLTAYDVYSLPANAAVAWYADGQNLNEYTAPGGQQPVPYAYVINPGSNDYVIGTLTATVTAGNNVLGVLNKYVDTTGGFSGTWYQQATLNDTVNSTPKPFLHNSLLEFVPNRTVYLLSDHFNNATISHSESGVFLSGWSNSNGVISFNPIQPINYTGSSSIIIEGTAQSGCKKFRLQLFSPPSLIDDPILLAKNPNGSTYEFSISEDVRSRQEILQESSNPLEWRLTIIKIDSANKIFDEMVRASSISVNVSRWPRGIYIAIAQIKDQYYSLKFSVGE